MGTLERKKVSFRGSAATRDLTESAASPCCGAAKGPLGGVPGEAANTSGSKSPGKSGRPPF